MITEDSNDFVRIKDFADVKVRIPNPDDDYIRSKTLLFIFLAENKRFTEFEFATGNDLETSEVPLSVLFCFIKKNAFSNMQR